MNKTGTFNGVPYTLVRNTADVAHEIGVLAGELDLAHGAPCALCPHLSTCMGSTYLLPDRICGEGNTWVAVADQYLPILKMRATSWPE
jgi:hypothetical protein